MRLLLLAQQYRAVTSGLGTYARGLVAGLARAGHEVALAVPETEIAETPGVRFVPLSLAPGNVTPFRFRRLAREFRRALAAESGRHDLVHFLDAREAALGGRPGLPAVGSVHDTYALDWRGRGEPDAPLAARLAAAGYYAWLRRLEPSSYARLRALVANSRHVAEALTRGYGVPADRVRVVPLFLPPAPPAMPERLPGSPAVLFVGGNYLRKGLPALLRAAALLRQALPGLVVHVVGGDRRRPRFERLAARLSVAGRVVFHGWRDNERVRALMAGADVFAMPSRVEAFGLVYLEAMRAGTPVIATRRGGAAEAFADGREALLVDPDDPAAVAAAIRRVAEEKDLRRTLVEGGRAAAARFTPEAAVAATEAVYREVLAATSAAR